VAAKEVVSSLSTNLCLETFPPFDRVALDPFEPAFEPAFEAFGFGTTLSSSPQPCVHPRPYCAAISPGERVVA
jgi:hypothetical protein